MASIKIIKTSSIEDKKQSKDASQKPVVNNSLKDVFNIFKQFILVGGDLA